MIKVNKKSKDDLRCPLMRPTSTCHVLQHSDPPDQRSRAPQAGSAYENSHYDLIYQEDTETDESLVDTPAPGLHLSFSKLTDGLISCRNISNV
jgi:hypothetical protein